MTGELSKVKIQAYKDKRFENKHGEFDLPINPEQLSQSFKVEYDAAQDIGAQGNDLQYKCTKPEEIKLEFTFDGTGVVPIKGKPNTFYKDVGKQVQELLNVVYTMQSDTHRPNFLRLLWGNLTFGTTNSFDCILIDLQINYTLFAPDGKPLRAKINATFVSYIEAQRRVRKEGKQSPDVTHVRKVTAGDTLPLMTHRIYGDPSYYLQVAKVNGLVNFRRLLDNKDLRFPPLEKTEV
ncbi:MULTISPECIES: CIS tube protein [Calothrix]|uniref:LysM peptidoglycan-binding domain-containing protein n=2 Tax=Calothrix TaxID=1186 RepID=A0ABR8AJD7_9CYAN|nr:MULTISPECIES: LysM peptidoglycan-binding domain-containing protein [Calothrix]MBD2199388.1 LysM peptidoglycan-binding domain-containing protein [Calothrix parietina FACHB-288]MBD2228072.1 LysM peptidoglycan-binding domain-containing protein [Calothrix anomala FACHB-343]